MQDSGEIDRQAEAMNDTWATMSEEERLDLLRRLPEVRNRMAVLKGKTS